MTFVWLTRMPVGFSPLTTQDEDEGTNVEEENREKGELETNSVEGDLERKEVPEALMAKEDL